ncbi:unnamed protein product [Arabidopsis lyrata]|nr:unnamed protein product [Arabidopsis lyrata]
MQVSGLAVVTAECGNRKKLLGTAILQVEIAEGVQDMCKFCNTGFTRHNNVTSIPTNFPTVLAQYYMNLLKPEASNVVKDEEYKGEIWVALSFKPSENRSRGIDEESYGGWKNSEASY